MRKNPVRAKLQNGEAVYGIFAVEFFTPGFCQIAAGAGAEFVIFDQEHGAVGIDVLKAQIAFARGTGIAPFVRVPGLAYHLIAPVLDAGAMGIMVPMIESGEQAEKLANWCRYRPLGVRGLGFGVSHDDYSRGEVVSKTAQANERTLVIALIETAAGIANADEILRIPGVDVGWLGHYDLTDSMGITAEFDRPEFDAAVEGLLAACNRNGKAAGFLATSVEMARAWRRKGFRCLSYGTDIGV
ncbi:MAG: aldolase, partial [Rhizobiales bacterium]|nr:aldolase [Hyphomicrobiales bacterium]